MLNRCFLFLFCLYSICSAGQTYKISGKIVNNKLEGLPLVSIKVKGSPEGTISRDDGSYDLKLESGKYELIFTMVGFKAQVIQLVLNKNLSQHIILEEQDKSLDEAIVSSKLRDRSLELIRKVISHKDSLQSAAGAYSITAYIKAVQYDSSVKRNKKSKAAVDTLVQKSAYNKFQQMAMAEILLRYDRGLNKKEKEERTAVSKRGDPSSLFYLSVTEGDFNLYNNLIYIRSVSPVPFLSPVSYAGLAAYRYKLLSTVQSGSNRIFTISFRPRDLSNVTLEGEMTIMDSAWVILHSKFTLPPYHMPEYDFMEVEQDYRFINNKAWMISKQRFNYFSKHGKGKLNGYTVVDFQSFELNKKFPARYFGQELSATAEEAYKKDSLFWEQSRTEPLTADEIHFIQRTDSIKRLTSSKAWLDSIDRVRNKISWKKLLLTGQSFYNREKESSWYLPSLTSFYQPFQFGGGRLTISAFHSKGYKSKKYLTVWGDISYGLRNYDVNGNIRVIKMYNPFNRAFYRFEAGRNFSYIFQGDAWINMLRRKNLYLKNSIGIGHGQEIFNGLFLNTDLDFAERRSLAGYKTGTNIDSLFGGILDDNLALAFPAYNALYGKIKLSWTPAQQYIREPRQKIIIGSKWPTFYGLWRKGIKGPLNSAIDFDYLEFGIEQQLKLGTTGISKYSILSGSFLNRKDLRLVDYKFQRRGDPLLFMNPEQAFQALDSSFAVFKRFYEGHYLHEFNGALINKIPFMKKLQLKEIAGGGFLFAPERDLKYAELFAGIERAFKWPLDKLQRFKIGVYIVTSAANKFNNPVQFKIGITSWDKTRDRWY